MTDVGAHSRLSILGPLSDRPVLGVQYEIAAKERGGLTSMAASDTILGICRRRR